MKKQIKLLTIITVMIGMVSLAACAGLIKNTYVTLSVSKVSYDKAMLSVADYQKQGLITPQQREEINRVAKVFKEAHNTLVDALEVYARTGTASDKEKVLTAMTSASTKWSQVAKLINAIKPGTVNSTFGKE